MQDLCAVFFVSDIVLTVLGVPFAPIPWVYREVMELAWLRAVLSLAWCSAPASGDRRFGARGSGKGASRRVRRVHGSRGDEHFEDWGLTLPNATWRSSR
jgi:hypothetical protein